MSNRITAYILPALLAGTLIFALLQPGCTPDQTDDPCLNHSTFVDGTSARHLLDVPLPFAPGPVAVIHPTEDGQAMSRSGKLWLGDEGLTLYAVDQASVWQLDLGTGDRQALGCVDRQAGQLTSAEEDAALLVTDPERGTVTILDETGHLPPVAVPAGAGAGALALGPGRRIAYVANTWAHSLSLVATGVGVIETGDRSVIVGAQDGGELLVMDGDGRTRERFQGLPSRLLDLTVLPGGNQLLATYSEILVTGDPGTLGDGEIVLDEGVVLLDLTTGERARWPLPRDAYDGGPTALARPTGIALLDGGRAAALALPGWSAVALIDLDPESVTQGQLTRLIPVPGRPHWVVPATFEPDWLYLLDTEAGTVIVLDRKGRVTHQIGLR